MNKGSRKVKGSGKEERIQNYSGSHSTNECRRYKACGKTGSDENDSVSKTRSDKSNSTRKTGSDKNSFVAKTRSNDNSSVGKTGSHDNGSASRPGKRRARDSDQRDQGNYSDGFHNHLSNENSGPASARYSFSRVEFNTSFRQRQERDLTSNLHHREIVQKGPTSVGKAYSQGSLFADKV
jgi:hypothetical protein